MPGTEEGEDDVETDRQAVPLPQNQSYPYYLRPPPTRIASKQTTSRQGKTKSEMNSECCLQLLGKGLTKCFLSVESISFDSPLLSDISAETPGVGGWGAPVQEAEEDLNSALDEALENYDLAASWINNEGDKDVVRK